MMTKSIKPVKIYFIAGLGKDIARIGKKIEEVFSTAKASKRGKKGESH